MDEQNNNIMIKISTFIVDKRNIIYALFAIFILYCLISIPKVKVNNDITTYLDESTETRISVDIMNEEFTTYGTAKVMVSNITYENAESLQKKIEHIDNVKTVDFENTEEYYTDSAALFSVTFDDDGESDESKEAMLEIRELLSGYDTYISTEVGTDEAAELQNQMTVILAISIVIIIIVLLFTSQTYAEVIVLLTVFIVAAIMNSGTNCWFGEISFITNSIAVVLQLALAIDYAIILIHRFAEERETHDTREAIIVALSKAIIEISSSSLTTISGLIALTFMQLRIGMDMGLVLSKGILCSLISVFLLMPGLLLQFAPLLDKTKHRSFIPSITIWGKIVVKTRYIFPFVFIAVAAAGAILSSNCPYAYDESSVTAGTETEQSIADNKINETFGISNTMAVMVPKGDYDSEAKILAEVLKLDRVTDALGLANIEVEEDGATITEKMKPRELSELMDIDYELVCLLYRAYGMKNENYAPIFGDVDDFGVALIDMVDFIREETDNGVIDLEDQQDDFDELYDALEDAKKQLLGENYSRLVFQYKGDVEGEESYQFLEDVRNIAKQYYENPIIASNTTSSYDLYSSFKSDNVKISFVTILFVFLVLIFTFRSGGIPVLLVLTIQGSIWINFSIPTLKNEPIFFLGYLVVSSIQMGATIDYAIVMTNRYEALKKNMEHRMAVIQTINQAFPTIFTSGSILTMSGILVGKISSNPIISGLGVSLGRGTIISIILVMFVLPQILILCDKFIDKSYIKTKERAKKKKRSGKLTLNGKIDGYVEGYVKGVIVGTVDGNVNAKFDNLESGENNETN